MNQEMKRRVTACAAGFSLPRYRELPSVGLYLDQTVQLVNSCFRGFPGVELTPSMVSNYVKQRLIPAPQKKVYTAEQLARLMFIAAVKPVVPLEGLRLMFGIQEGIKRGNIHTHGNLYGYKYYPKPENRLEVREDEAEAVRLIFDLYANKNMGVQRIGEYLTEHGIFTRQGKPFSGRSLLI